MSEVNCLSVSEIAKGTIPMQSCGLKKAMNRIHIKQHLHIFLNVV